MLGMLCVFFFFFVLDVVLMLVMVYSLVVVFMFGCGCFITWLVVCLLFVDVMLRVVDVYVGVVGEVID